MDGDSTKFHHDYLSTQFKNYEIFISEIFHLIFSDCGWPQVINQGNKTADKEGLLYFITVNCRISK